jgi:hypothetical protein
MRKEKVKRRKVGRNSRKIPAMAESLEDARDMKERQKEEPLAYPIRCFGRKYFLVYNIRRKREK